LNRFLHQFLRRQKISKWTEAANIETPWFGIVSRFSLWQFWTNLGLILDSPTKVLLTRGPNLAELSKANERKKVLAKTRLGDTALPCTVMPQFSDSFT
jgi:hypothetical protein